MDSLFKEDAPENYNHPALYYIAKSIDMMGKVDAVYFAKDWQLNRGCRTERQIAIDYGVKILNTDFINYEKKEEILVRQIEVDDSVPGHEFFKELKQIERRIMPGESV